MKQFFVIFLLFACLTCFSQANYLFEGISHWRNNCFLSACFCFEKINGKNLKSWQKLIILESAIFAGNKTLVEKYFPFDFELSLREEIRYNILCAYILYFNGDNYWKNLFKAEQKMRVSDDNFVGERLLLAQFYILSGKKESGRIINEYVQTLFPDEKRTLKILGILYEFDEDYNNSLMVYKDYLSYYADGWVLMRMAEIYKKIQKYRNEVSVLEELIELSGERADLLYLLSEAVENTGNIEYAQILLKKIIDEYPDSELISQCEFKIAKIRMEKQKDASSLSILARLVRNFPDNQEYYEYYKIACSQFGYETPNLNNKKYASDIVYGHAELNKNPQNPKIYLKLYSLYMDSKNYEKALQILNRLIKNFPENKEYKILQLKLSMYVAKQSNR